MTVPACKSCGAAENRPCVEPDCAERGYRGKSFRLDINSYQDGNGGVPAFRIRAWGFVEPFPKNWREILEAGADA